MRIVGIILLVLGLAGIGAGVYGMMTLEECDSVISTNTSTLREKFPELEGVADLTSISDLVAVDRILKDSGDLATKYLAWNILMAMGDKDDATMIQNVGFGAGGGLFVVGLLLTLLGGKKKKTADA